MVPPYVDSFVTRTSNLDVYSVIFRFFFLRTFCTRYVAPVLESTVNMIYMIFFIFRKFVQNHVRTVKY